MTAADDLPGGDEVLACVDLVGRAGARGFAMGYLRDNPKNPGWWAHAQYRGRRIAVENHATPNCAARALAERLLIGGQCRCGKLVALSKEGARAFDSTLVTGERWTPEQARKAGQCLWRLDGQRWEPGCDAPSLDLPEFER
jgi:hypothetical protein